MLLFSDAAVVESADIKLIGVIAILVGVVAWVLKSAVPGLARQYREDIFNLFDAKQSANKELTTQFGAMLDKVNDRHERELAKRDAQFDRLAGAVEKLCERVEQLETNGLPPAK